MFGSTTLDIVIGLVFVFLLYSLLATIIQELIASWLGFRSKMLEKAIIRMLNDGRTNPDADAKMIEKMQHTFSAAWERVSGFFFFRPGNYHGSFAAKFYNQPSIKYLAEDAWHNKPGYLTPDQFSKAVLDILRGEDVKPGDDIAARVKRILFPDTETGTDKSISLPFNIQPETIQYLQSMFIDAKSDIETFKKSLEDWFDSTMERASGWYKKYVQMLLFFIGLGIALFFNVDTLKIVSALSKDKNAREQLVELASGSEKYRVIVNQADTARKNGNLIVFGESDTATQKRDSVFNMVKADLDRSSEILGMGWKVPSEKDPAFCDNTFKGDATKINECKKCFLKMGHVREKEKIGPLDKIFFLGQTQFGLRVLIGWMVTALAISLGAPFWFDLLNKFMQLRGSVSKKKGKK